MKIIIDYLKTFCAMSGQKLNYGKNNIFFSSNVKEENGKRIVESSGFNMTLNLGMYVGMPVNHKRVSKHTFQHVIKKVQDKLVG